MHRVFRWFLIAIILFFLATRVLTFREGVVDRCISYCVYPVLVVERALLEPLKKWHQRRVIMRQVFEKYERLQKKYQSLLSESIMHAGLLDVDRNFYELVDFKQRYGHAQVVPVQVIQKHFDHDGHFFYIDKGSRQGLVEDMIVVSQNCLIGRVSTVYPWYSKVTLLTDTGSKVPAVCVDSGAQGILEGANSLEGMRLAFVSHLNNLELGDMIVSRGEGLIFPKGFGLGRIVSYEKNGLHYEIDVEPLCDFSTIESCYVIHKGACYFSK